VKLSFSNLAWERVDDVWVAPLLRSHEVALIDLTPAKYFAPGTRAADAEVRAVRGWWSEQGIGIVGMQALLHGTVGLNLFGDAATRGRMLAHLAEICRIGELLGATRLTFGAPRSRDRGDLSPAAATTRAVEFFRELGAIANAHGVALCLEPVPARYGGNFMNETASTSEVVRNTDHRGIRLQLDLGAVTDNAEDLHEILAGMAQLVGHVHLSEPGLAPLGDSAADHAAAGRLLRQFMPGQVLTIEMLAAAATRRQDMERALQVARRHYLE